MSIEKLIYLYLFIGVFVTILYKIIVSPSIKGPTWSQLAFEFLERVVIACLWPIALVRILYNLR